MQCSPWTSFERNSFMDEPEFFHSLFLVSIGQFTADKMDEGLGKDILWKYCCL